MGTRLPLVAPHAREHTYCAYCPKLCRHTCPVSTVEGRETTTPWGKMTSLHHVDVGHLPPHESHASTWFACTGCLACRESCAHGNEVAAALNAGRAESVARGIAPKAATALLDGHGRRMDRLRAKAHATFGAALTTSAPVVFVPGCTATLLDEREATAGVRVLEAVLGTRVRVEAEGCCGLPLLEGGDPRGFLNAAELFATRVRGSKHVVFGDPGCMMAMTRIAPQMGVRTHSRSEHLVSVLHRERAKLRRGHASGDGGAVRYHDACKLGRGLGLYDEPRELLGHLLGKPPAEFERHRAGAACSGAGGQLPRTMGDTARAIARDRVDEHTRLGGGLVVTACVASKRALSEAGAHVSGLATWVEGAIPP